MAKTTELWLEGYKGNRNVPDKVTSWVIHAAHDGCRDLDEDDAVGEIYGRDDTEARDYARLFMAAPELLTALHAAERALWVHTFRPRGHETPADRDTCIQCGHNFRHEHHLAVKEGHPSDVKAEASRLVRAAIARATPSPTGGTENG